MIKAGKAKDYAKARAIHDQLLPVTRNVYHRGSHYGRYGRAETCTGCPRNFDHATVRSPLLPLADGAEQEIHDAMRQAGIGKVDLTQAVA